MFETNSFSFAPWQKNELPQITLRKGTLTPSSVENNVAILPLYEREGSPFKIGFMMLLDLDGGSNDVIHFYYPYKFYNTNSTKKIFCNLMTSEWIKLHNVDRKLHMKKSNVNTPSERRKICEASLRGKREKEEKKQGIGCYASNALI